PLEPPPAGKDVNPAHRLLGFERSDEQKLQIVAESYEADDLFGGFQPNSAMTRPSYRSLMTARIIFCPSGS
ncbi:hypothetical protein ACC734_38135, partial [Rhizobium ruizarguesonis]